LAEPIRAQAPKGRFPGVGAQHRGAFQDVDEFVLPGVRVAQRRLGARGQRREIRRAIVAPSWCPSDDAKNARWHCRASGLTMNCAQPKGSLMRQRDDAERNHAPARASNAVVLRLSLLPALLPTLIATSAFAQSAAPDCQGQSVEQCIAACRRLYPDDAQKDARYACFDHAEAPAPVEPAGKEATPPPAPPSDSADLSPLTRLWSDSGTHISFAPYRQSYMLVTRTDHPNNAPTSPNPVDRVPPSYDLEHNEAKFQFSLKALLFRDLTFDHGGRYNLWFGYTQQSYWQIFDSGHSRPFRESNYEPEVIVSRPLQDLNASLLGLRPGFVNVGLVHQSNGQSDPRSRSWNRVYAQVGAYRNFDDGSSFALLLRPWYRFHEGPADDNNPDITHYLGFGDLELIYWRDPLTLSALARVRSLQLDASWRIWPSPGGSQARAVQLHLQLFSGYGESLIDYNQSHTTIGVGISVPYGL
jgi:phospholipase A1/A2